MAKSDLKVNDALVNISIQNLSGELQSICNEIFTPATLGLIVCLNKKLMKRRDQLLATRKRKQEHYDQGKYPEYPDKLSDVVVGDWAVSTLPEDLKTRRVEITGPATDKCNIAKMCYGDGDILADVATIDFEDTIVPSFDNIIDGYNNVRNLFNGTLKKEYGIDSSKKMTNIMFRVRNLHLAEKNIEVDGNVVSAAICDFAVCLNWWEKIY